MIVSPFFLNKRVQFGHFKEEVNEHTGAIMKHFEKEFSRWGNIRSRTLKEEVQMEGTSFENTLSLVVRNSKKINKQLVVELEDVCYQIVSISFPHDPLFSDFIFLSVKKIDKVGT